MCKSDIEQEGFIGCRHGASLFSFPTFPLNVFGGTVFNLLTLD